MNPTVPIQQGHEELIERLTGKDSKPMISEDGTVPMIDKKMPGADDDDIKFADMPSCGSGSTNGTTGMTIGDANRSKRDHKFELSGVLNDEPPTQLAGVNIPSADTKESKPAAGTKKNINLDSGKELPDRHTALKPMDTTSDCWAQPVVTTSNDRAGVLNDGPPAQRTGVIEAPREQPSCEARIDEPGGLSMTKQADCGTSTIELVNHSHKSEDSTSNLIGMSNSEPNIEIAGMQTMPAVAMDEKGDKPEQVEMRWPYDEMLADEPSNDISYRSAARWPRQC